LQFALYFAYVFFSVNSDWILLEFF